MGEKIFTFRNVIGHRSTWTQLATMAWKLRAFESLTLFSYFILWRTTINHDSSWKKTVRYFIRNPVSHWWKEHRMKPIPQVVIDKSKVSRGGMQKRLLFSKSISDILEEIRKVLEKTMGTRKHAWLSAMWKMFRQTATRLEQISMRTLQTNKNFASWGCTDKKEMPDAKSSIRPWNQTSAPTNKGDTIVSNGASSSNSWSLRFSGHASRNLEFKNLRTVHYKKESSSHSIRCYFKILSQNQKWQSCTLCQTQICKSNTVGKPYWNGTCQMFEKDTLLTTNTTPIDSPMTSQNENLSQTNKNKNRQRFQHTYCFHSECVGMQIFGTFKNFLQSKCTRYVHRYDFVVHQKTLENNVFITYL